MRCLHPSYTSYQLQPSLVHAALSASVSFELQTLSDLVPFLMSAHKFQALLPALYLCTVQGFRYRKVANNKGSVLVDSRVGDEFRKSSPLPGCAPLEVTGKVTRQCRSSALVKDSQSAIHNDSKLRQGRRSSGRDRGSTAAQASRDAGKPPSEAAAEGGLAEKLGDRPLRLVIVGHNPSAHAWASGHYYSNPSNWMWRILLSTGIAPEGIR